MDARRWQCLLLVVALGFVASCVASGPAVSKKTHGNLEVEVEWVGRGPGADEPYAEVIVDGNLLGHISKHRPVLYLRKGEHEVEVRSPGYVPWKRMLLIVGEPNRQFIHVVLRKAE